MSKTKQKQKQYLVKNGEVNCFYCGKFFGKNGTYDHVFPRSKSKNKGVSFLFTCVMSCECCNRKKADRQPTFKEVEKLKRIIKKRLSYNDESTRFIDALKSLN